MSKFHLLNHNGLKALIDKITAYFYTKAEIDDMLSAGMKYEVVEELPATGEAGTVYLVPKQTAGTGDVYDEYIYVDGSYEHIGSTEIDLSNYYTKAQTDNLLGDKVDKESGKGLSTEDFTTAEKTKLGGIEAGAEVNVQSDWNQSDSTKDDFIKNKPTLRQPSTDGTSGQYLKSNGSGNAPSWETMDSAPTANSTKAVTSGGVKTALDGKQASISITNKTDDAGDNDKVIMQASGVTDTTTFVRRSLSNLLNWFRSKLDKVYFKRGDITTQIGSNYLYNLAWDNKFYCADVRFHVESHIYNMESGEEVTGTGMPVVKQFFDGKFAHYYSHPQTGEKQVVTITAASQTSDGYLFAYGNGRLLVCFYSSKTPNAISLRYKQRNSDTWMSAGFSVSSLSTSIYEASIPWTNSTYINTFEITIEGKTNAEVAYPGTSIAQIVLLCPENGQFNPSQQALVNKYADAQRIFGNVEMAKIIKTNGTSSQVLLANGDVMSLPVPINKGGTGATTAIGAEYNILNQVADISTTLSDTRKIALCNQTKSASTGVFRWIALSNVWNWIKTHFDSSPTSGSDNGITSGGVYSALEEKVNLQPDFTASQIDYSAGNVGKWQKVLRFPEGADLVINMKKTAMGSDATSTLWFSSSSMGDSYTSLFGNHSVRFVHDGGYVFLVLACLKNSNMPLESYTFQIAHSSVPMSDIVAVTDASPITATPKEPNIVYRAPITTGAVSFNVNSSGAGSVSMSGHNDFLGNMTSEASNGVVVTMSGATEGQIYRFVFTRNITGGVTFKQSNVAYCTIQGDVNAGDTITLTAVSNTADGWLYEQESAGIESSDGSNMIEYNGSTADVRVNWEKLPADLVRNKAYGTMPYDSEGNLALGDGADVGNEYVTYGIAIGKDATVKYHDEIAIGRDSVADGGDSIAIGRGASANDQSDAMQAIAVGYQAFTLGDSAIAIGTYANAREYSIALGHNADSESGYAIAIGENAKANANNGAIAMGAYAEGAGYDSIGMGDNAIADGDSALAIGRMSNSGGGNAIAIGSGSGVFERIERNNVKNYGRMKAFNLLKFSVNGTQLFFKRVTGQVTVTYGNEDYIVNASKGMILLTNDADAVSIYSFVHGIWLDSNYYSTTSGAITRNFNVFPLYEGSSVYVIDCGMGLADRDTSDVASAYMLASYAVLSQANTFGCAIGASARAYGGVAIGEGSLSANVTQAVIGSYNVPSDSDYFQVGSGSSEVNRKNILKVDSSERMVINAGYVGGTQTIEMNQQTGSLSNITKSVYKIKWDGTGTIRLTIGTGGCVEGQRVSIVAVTNDIVIFGTTILIPVGTFGDFLFLDGAWMPSSGVWHV